MRILVRSVCLVRSISIIDVFLELIIWWLKSLAGILFLSACQWLPEPGMGALVENTTGAGGQEPSTTILMSLRSLTHNMIVI